MTWYYMAIESKEKVELVFYPTPNYFSSTAFLFFVHLGRSRSYRVMVAHAFNPSAWEAETGRYL